jgi:hypothetical protein
VDLCRGTVADYLERFGFRSDLLKVMYAVSCYEGGQLRGAARAAGIWCGGWKGKGVACTPPEVAFALSNRQLLLQLRTLTLTACMARPTCVACVLACLRLCRQQMALVG